MTNFVPDEGSPNARIVLVGEAPGRWENQLLRPFVGPSGQKLEQNWWPRVGLLRSNFYITNVYPYWPRQGIDAVPKDEIEHWINELHDRLAALTDPWLIVPTGNKALYALTGQGKFRQGEKKPGITSHRGSIYSYTDRRGREIKVIPTIHPAHTLWRASRKRDEGVVEQRNWERACILDWTRIADDATFRELRLPQREHFIRPTLDDVYDYVHGAIKLGEPIAVDIENLPDFILCVGFSNDPAFSMTVPTTPSYWKDDYVLRHVWDAIRTLMASGLEKIGQNWLYDAWHLSRNGCEITNFVWDCLAQHHCLDPVDNHDLAYMASIFTRQPYWKDETKDPEEVMKYASDEEALWTYCGIDAAVERELSDTLHVRLAAAGRMEFYNRYYRQLFAPILRIMLHGVGLDDHQRRHKLAALQARVINAQDRLTEIAGEPLYGKTDLSTKKLKHFLYTTLRLPPILNRKTGRATTNEVAVRRLLLRYPNKPQLAEAGALILDHRRTATVARFLKEERLDPDGRWRFTMGPYAETCRMRASKNPAKRGASPHNFDRELRDIVKPDPGCVFLGVDLSQAEDRVVKMLTRSKRLINLARLHPDEWDAHKHSAHVAFGTPIDEVDYDQRYLGKRAKHATNYDMHGRRLSDELLKEGYVIPSEEAQRIIDKLHADSPEIKEVYHKETRSEVMRNRCLSNIWGAIIDFEYERLDDDLYRRAYAWRPQSDIAILMNLWGFIPADEYLLKPCCHAHSHAGIKPAINLHMQDGLWISTPPEHAWDIAVFLQSSLEQPIYYYGEPVTIWTEFSLGSMWKAELEYKRLPNRKEFTDAAFSLLDLQKES
jgi:uracil-DNA glycosylase family 4